MPTRRPLESTPPLRRPWSRSARPVPTRIVRPLQEFVHREAAGGVVLALATAAALVWANVAPHSYEGFWETKLQVGIGSWGHAESLRHVVNDGLMALFFFVIGLEVKRELTTGELADRRAALLPLAAAIGGMALPAAIFLLVAAGSDGGRSGGWGIPMATDIAFALGVLALLGSRVPAALTVLMLGIAVIDDIGAIIVIAIFYSGGIEWWWLLGAALGLVAIRGLRELQVRAYAPYVLLGLWVWLATFESGVHATIAGVALGLLTPAFPFQQGDAVSSAAIRIANETRDDADDQDKDASEWRVLAWLSREAISPLAQLEHALHPWTSMLVLPLFALANVGIVIDAGAIQAAAGDVLTLAIGAGLVIGKPAGVLLGAFVAVRLGIAQLPPGVRWRHVVGLGALAGIGFTMSLFVTTLAFDSVDLVARSTMAVLAASVAAGVVGAAVLLAGGRPDERVAD